MTDKPPPKHTGYGNYLRADWFEARLAVLEAQWNDAKAVQAQLEALWLAKPPEEGKARLTEVLHTKAALENKTDEQLVDIALEHMSLHVTDNSYELVIEELCTRIDCNWHFREPSAGDTHG